MSLFTEFKEDASKVADGTWHTVTYTQDGDPISFLLAHPSEVNKKYTAVVERVLRPHRRAMASGKLGEDISQRLAKEIFVEGVIKDWRNVTNEAGEKVAFSKDNALELINKLPMLYAELEAFARDFANYRYEDLETDVKNLPIALQT